MNQDPHAEVQTNQAVTVKENPFLSGVEGYYLGAILDGLHRSGILTHLKNPLTVKQLAEISETDARLLNPLLTYLSSHGQCLVYDPTDKTYSVHSSYFDSPMAAHLLDQYIGAYGPCLTRLDTVLSEPSTGGTYIDRTRHAAAFAKASGAPPDLIELILGMTPNTVLDLGCGSAGLLRKLTEADQQINGIGVDMNEAMLDFARKNAVDSTRGRLQFHVGDALSVAEILPDNIRETVDVIIAQNVANEFFAERSIDSFLNYLSSTFPNRLLIIADYYGCLNGEIPLAPSNQRRGALHDIAQLLSGQGIPPSALEDWQSIYKRNECVLLKASSIISGGLHRFIHIVKT